MVQIFVPCTDWFVCTLLQQCSFLAGQSALKLLNITFQSFLFIQIWFIQKENATSTKDWVLDKEELEYAFNENTRAIIFNTPHNPTGKVVNKPWVVINYNKNSLLLLYILFGTRCVGCHIVKQPSVNQIEVFPWEKVLYWQFSFKTNFSKINLKKSF